MKLEIQQLRKNYGSHIALDAVDLAPTEAAVLVLIGPSGGGKSTLLRLLGGLEVPSSGMAWLNDTPLPSTEQMARQHRARNGFLFQQFNLFPHLSALENISLPLQLVHHLSVNDARERAQSALQRFGLATHGAKTPAQLSGGQQQRVGLARAIAANPEILFLDEPTSALDPEMTAEVLELIHELAQAGQSIILSTHEMGFARAIASTIAFVSAGKITETAAPDAFFSRPKTEQCQRFLSKVMRY